MNRIWGVRLGDVVDVTMGQAPSGDTYNDVGEGLPLIAGAGDFGAGVPSAKKFTSSPTKTCRHGDIVMSIRATIGTKVVSDGEYCLGRGVAGLRATGAMDQRYLWHWLGFTEADLAAKGRGATFLQVSRSDITEMGLELPPLDEQRRIAAILDTADALRQKRKRAIALLDSLTRSIFLEMFGDPFRGGVHDHKSVPLRSVTRRITYGFTQPMSHHENGIPILTGKNVKLGSIDYDNVHFTNQTDFDSLTDKSRPTRGDILVTKDGTIGRAAVFDRDEPVCINQSVCLVQLDKTQVEPEYVLHYIISDSVQRRIDAMKKGNSIPHLQITEFANFPVPLPPKGRQLEFLERVEHNSKMRGRLSTAYLATEYFFASLQHRAFSGQL